MAGTYLIDTPEGEFVRKEISLKLITQAKLQKEYEKTNVPVHQPNPNNLNGI